MASPPPEANRSLQAKPLSGTVHPGSSQTPLSTSKSCLKTPIYWPSTNPAGCPPSPAEASWKTPSCAWCKSKPPTQTLSTGWADHHWHRPLCQNTAGGLESTRKLEHTQNSESLPGAGSKHCTARGLRNPHTHWPRAAPAHRFRVGRQPRWQTVKVIGKGDLTCHQHHNI
jgi:hypothetical protein